MLVLLIASMPNEPFSSYIRDGSAGGKMQKILEHIKPQSAVFVEIDGKRTGVFTVDLPDPSGIPSLAEPFFLTFNASVTIRPCMTPADLMKANLEAVGKKWA